VLEEGIWSFLNISMEEGRIITAHLDAKYKTNIFQGLGQKHIAEDKLEGFNSLVNVTRDLYVDRNFISHGKWRTLLPDNIPGAASLREKVNAAFDQSDVIVETFPKQRMISILRDIIIANNTIIDFIDAHETSHGRPQRLRRRT
jgi:hypothetical protein